MHIILIIIIIIIIYIIIYTYMHTYDYIIIIYKYILWVSGYKATLNSRSGFIFTTHSPLFALLFCTCRGNWKRSVHCMHLYNECIICMYMDSHIHVISYVHPRHCFNRSAFLLTMRRKFAANRIPNNVYPWKLFLCVSVWE